MNLESLISTIFVLFVMFVYIYSVIKKQSILDTLKDLKEGFNELFEKKEEVEVKALKW